MEPPRDVSDYCRRELAKTVNPRTRMHTEVVVDHVIMAVGSETSAFLCLYNDERELSRVCIASMDFIARKQAAEVAVATSAYVSAYGGPSSSTAETPGRAPASATVAPGSGSQNFVGGEDEGTERKIRGTIQALYHPRTPHMACHASVLRKQDDGCGAWVLDHKATLTKNYDANIPDWTDTIIQNWPGKFTGIIVVLQIDFPVGVLHSYLGQATSSLYPTDATKDSDDLSEPRKSNNEGCA